MTPSRTKKAPGSAGRTAIDPSDAVARELLRINALGISALRALWKGRFRGEPPAIQSSDVLRRLIAWKIQVEAFGDLDTETASRIRLLMRSGKKDGAGEYAVPASLKVGTVLVREWRGIEHRVLVLDDRFEHRDLRYKSLSQAARAITGTNWSGPRFFGLVPKPVRSVHKNDVAP